MGVPATRDLRPVEPPRAAPVQAPAPEGPPPTRPPVRVRTAGLQGYALVTLAALAVVAALRMGAGFFIPIILAFVIALSLAPIVRRLSGWMPRAVAAALVVGTLAAGVGSLAYTLSDEAAAAIAGLPKATRQLRQAMRVATRQSAGPIAQLQKAVNELERTATESADRPSTPSGVMAVQVVEPPIDVRNFMWMGSRGLLTMASQLVLVGFLIYFLLSCGELFKRKLVMLSGESLSRKKVTVQMIDHMGERMARVFMHLILMGSFVGTVTWLGLSYLGVAYAGLWGLAAGVLNAVPYFGPTVVASGLFVAGLVQFGSVGPALAGSAVSITVTSLEGFFLTPWLFGQVARLNPVAVFVSFLFWGWLWGPWGMLLALPLLMIVKTIAETVTDLNPLAELLSD